LICQEIEATLDFIAFKFFMSIVIICYVLITINNIIILKKKLNIIIFIKFFDMLFVSGQVGKYCAVSVYCIYLFYLKIIETAANMSSAASSCTVQLNFVILAKSLGTCHCEERSDVAIWVF